MIAGFIPFFSGIGIAGYGSFTANHLAINNEIKNENFKSIAFNFKF